jgi:hypothetical protein
MTPYSDEGSSGEEQDLPPDFSEHLAWPVRANRHAHVAIEFDHSLLSRHISRDPASPPETPFQKEVDQWVSGFVKQATDGRSLAALTAGGLTYRLGRIGALAAGTGDIASVGLGLGAEVSAFEITNRLLACTGTACRTPTNLWRWDGPGGIRQGLLNSLITFGALKGAGGLTAGENILVQHLVQDTAMVFGQNIAGSLQMAPKPVGSIAEQYFHAEALNLQLKAGMAFGHALTGGRLFALEKGLESSIRGDGFQENQLTPLLPSRTFFLEPVLDTVGSGLDFRPIRIFAMSKKEGEGGTRPPSSPKDVNAEQLEEIREALRERFDTARDDFNRQEKRIRGYLTIFFTRYANLITRWAFGDRDRPLEISPAERKNLERPLAQISSLVASFAVSCREMERIQFDFRRWRMALTHPIKSTYATFHNAYDRFSEVAAAVEKLVPVIDRPRLTLTQYSQIRRILESLEEKNFDWLVPTLPHTAFLPENKSRSRK